MDTNQEKRENKVLLISLAVIILMVVTLAVIGFMFINEPTEVVQGQAEATTVKISGKLPGRVETFYVQEGDSVKAGDTLVHIHSSVAEAKLMQAQAMTTAAQAQNRKVDAGVRTQTIQSAQDLWKQAQAASEIARKTFERMESLYKQGVVSAQKRDEAQAAYTAAQAGESAALSQYNLAKSGAQQEDKTSAAAMVTVARGGVKEVEAVLEDQFLLAPCDGVIDEIYPQQGELVALGAPIMSVLQADDKWITFNVREELLNDMPMGKEIEVMIPALGDTIVKARVYYVRDMGDYAVWRATKATGEWDSRTFKIKARPTVTLPNLRPGMSIIYQPK
ncbi:MAG: efflux RND transporter periplasmic adaptor subunit [Muribaculaceae bacterium]|nr:efflux RND transporter periplasmic adaptor subunit [Muribaculaceae bacterium]